MGPKAGPAASAAAALLDDPDPVTRQRAAFALGEIGPAARAALPALERALSDPDEVLRRRAREALEKLAR
jgi:HEAT repeat protein